MEYTREERGSSVVSPPHVRNTRHVVAGHEGMAADLDFLHHTLPESTLMLVVS